MVILKTISIPGQCLETDRSRKDIICIGRNYCGGYYGGVPHTRNCIWEFCGSICLIRMDRVELRWIFDCRHDLSFDGYYCLVNEGSIDKDPIMNSIVWQLFKKMQK
ncbi:MAG: hypothetical protein ACXWCG_06055, partial [Flavitalea sp.]